MDRGTWPATVHEVAKSQTRLSTNTFTFKSKQQTKAKTIEQKLYAILGHFFYLDFYRKGFHTLRLKYSKLSIEFKRKK